MSDSEQSAHSGRSRSKQSSRISRTEYALIEAATKKAELECAGSSFENKTSNTEEGV